LASNSDKRLSDAHKQGSLSVKGCSEKTAQQYHLAYKYRGDCGGSREKQDTSGKHFGKMK
jgi:hypothetical protein